MKPNKLCVLDGRVKIECVVLGFELMARGLRYYLLSIFFV